MKRLAIAALAIAALGAAVAFAQQFGMPPPAGVTVMGCVYNTTPPTLTNGNPGMVQCSSTGFLGTGGGGGGFTPTPVAPTVSPSGAVTSLVLKNSPTSNPGGVTRYHAENASATIGYCVLYNATAAPAPGALTAGLVLDFQLFPANGYCDVDHTLQPVAASVGAVVLLTSAATPFTYTTGAITGSIHGVAQ